MQRRHIMAAAALLFSASAALACAPIPPPGGPVLDVSWELMELNGQPVGTAANGERATLRLGSDGSASGNAGCNQYGGSYAMDGTAMTFSQLGMTRMYCEGFMDLETRFSAALENTRAWRLVDGALELLADGRVVARLTRG